MGTSSLSNQTKSHAADIELLQKYLENEREEREINFASCAGNLTKERQNRSEQISRLTQRMEQFEERVDSAQTAASGKIVPHALRTPIFSY